MSEGDTPDILEAWPIVSGFCFLSFCLPSEDIERSFSYLKFFGNLMFSNLVSFSALTFSFSM